MWDTYMGYIVTGLTALGTIIGILTTIVTTIKSHAKGKIAEKAQNALDILNVVNNAVIEAEKLVGASGQIKKAVATTAILNYAIKHDMDVEDATIDKMVEDCVSISKKINSRDKDVSALSVEQTQKVEVEGVSQDTFLNGNITSTVTPNESNSTDNKSTDVKTSGFTYGG